MKKLVNKELISEVNTMLKSQDARIESYSAEYNFAIRLGNIVIRKVSTGSVIELDPNVTKEMFALWKRDVGKFVSRDLRKKRYDTLFELHAAGRRVLLRKITQDELPFMRDEGFAHVYIGNYHYTIIKSIPENGSYLDADENTEVDDSVYSQYHNIMEFDNSQPVTAEEEMQQGMALFDDFNITSYNNEPANISEVMDILDETEEEE